MVYTECHLHVGSGADNIARNTCAVGSPWPLFLSYFLSAAAISSVLAYFVYSWQHLVMILSLGCVPFVIAYYFLIDESPRWLLSKKKTDRAVAIIQKMARINRNPITRNQIFQYILESDNAEELKALWDVQEEEERKPERDSFVLTKLPKQSKKTTSLLTLFTNLNLALITMAVSFLWAVNAMGKFG